MKLTGLIILVACLQVSAKTTAQKLSISLKNGSLEKLFAEIEHQTGFTIFYNAVDLQHAKPVTIEVKDASVEEILQLSLKNQPLTYFIQEHTIFIKKEAPKSISDVNTLSSDGAPPEVSGVVKSESGTLLAGATVYIRKLKKSVVTNAQGAFVLKGVPDGEYEVEISYVGYEHYSTKITVENHGAVLTAALKQSMSKLDETVVKGYYTTTDRLNTGDVTTVKGDVIEQQPVTDPLLALEGRVPGLYIAQTSGIPGAYSTIQIRGQNSIANGNDPLYIVDGVPYGSNSLTSPYIGGGSVSNPPPGSVGNLAGAGMSPFNALNTADIESIEVLKDADATAIYGSRGANGVILITTKKGKAGDTRVEANVYSGNGQVTRMLKLLNTPEYLEMRHEAFANDGITTIPVNRYDINGFWDTTRYTNWQKVLIGNNAPFTNAQINLSGGSSNTQFIMGGGYSRQGTVYPGDYADQKASGFINLTHSSADHRFHAQMTINYVNDNSNLPGVDLTNYILLAPDAPALYDANGNINWQRRANGYASWVNPLTYTLVKAMAKTNNLITNLNISYLILPGLQLKSSFGYNTAEMDQSIQTPATTVDPAVQTPSSRSNAFATTQSKTWIIEPQLNYEKKIFKGQLSALVGTTFQENTENSIGQVASGFGSDALIQDPEAASSVLLYGSNQSLYHYNALFGRIGYIWNEKYLLNLTARRDGSSRFGPGKQFGDFGAIGAGWIFSKEAFVVNTLPFLSFGKLRASYGITGNDQIGDYQYLSTYQPTGYSYQGLTNLSPTGLTNPYFAWEVNKKLEGGIELGFFKDRLLLTSSYFRNRSDNQLVGYALPLITGYSSVVANLPATVQNTGWEFTMNTVNIRLKNFTWSSTFNLTIPENKLIAFPNIQNTSYGYSDSVGHSLFTHLVYHNTGVNPQTGIYSFTTKNANGVPTFPQDDILSKSVTQSFFGGLGNSFNYKGLRFDIFLQFVKQLSYNNLSPNSNFYTPGLANENQTTSILGGWQKPGDLTGVEKFTQKYGPTEIAYENLQASDAAISNGSFVRVKNVVLSYELPNNIDKGAHLQNVRVYLQCQNLFTVTKYTGLDPETGPTNLPPLRLITAGLKIII